MTTAAINDIVRTIGIDLGKNVFHVIGTSLRRGASTAEDYSKRLRREAGSQTDVRCADTCGGTLARSALHRV